MNTINRLNAVEVAWAAIEEAEKEATARFEEDVREIKAKYGEPGADRWDSNAVCKSKVLERYFRFTTEVAALVIKPMNGSSAGF